MLSSDDQLFSPPSEELPKAEAIRQRRNTSLKFFISAVPQGPCGITIVFVCLFNITNRMAQFLGAGELLLAVVATIDYSSEQRALVP